MSLCHDLPRSVLALGLLDGGVPVRSATVQTAKPNEIVVRISPDGIVTINVPNEATKRKPRKQVPETRDAKVASYIATQLLECPDAVVSLREAAKATGIPKTTLARCKPWRDHQAECDRRSSGKLRTRQLTPEMVACVPDRMADDPAEVAELNETLETLIAQQERDDKSNRVL